MRRGYAQLVIILLALPARCADSPPPGEGEPSTNDVPELEILDVRISSPLVEGSGLLITARGLDRSRPDPRLEIQVSGVTASLADPFQETADTVLFALDREAVGQLGFGAHDAELLLYQETAFSAPYRLTITLSDTFDVRLDEVPQGAVFRNEEVVLVGAGFASANEGIVEAIFDGSFTGEAGTYAVSATLPAVQAERFDRGRGVVRLTTALGGLAVGTFEGAVRLRVFLNSGTTVESGSLSTSLYFQPPALFSFFPTNPTLGQIVTVQGGGFLGGDAEPDEATLLRLEGQFAAPFSPAAPVGPVEVVLGYASGQEGQLGILAEPINDRLVSSFFGDSEGTFTGTAAPIAIKGTEELAGDPVPFEMRLDGMRQIVVVAFLTGFHDSLRHYGLSSAATQVQDAALERMRSIYADYRVDFVTEPPDDYLPSAIAHLEIGGPDPNGLGLLGYDNAPGKDVGNVRLFDRIGGANAATQEDGFPGYGGVFIESFLYWSEEPGLSGDRPAGSPPPDPLFDEIFGSVRATAATLDEAEGFGDPARVAEVGRAIDALGSMIGETAAHEVGHSLGLAQPFGDPEAFHSALPAEGCLMDAGANRPLGERAGEPGFALTHFCADEPQYMEHILGR